MHRRRHRATAVAAGRGAGVRGVQLADHLVDHVHQLLAVGDEGDQGFVLGAHRVPIGAVQLGVVEAILHASPGVVEHFVPFLGLLDPDGDVEGDPALRRRRHRRRRSRPLESPPAGAAPGPPHAAAGAIAAKPPPPPPPPPQTGAVKTDSPSWKKRVRPSLVSRRLDMPPRKPPRMPRGRSSSVGDGRPGRTGGDAGHSLAVVLDRIDRRRPTATSAAAARPAAAVAPPSEPTKINVRPSLAGM